MFCTALDQTLKFLTHDTFFFPLHVHHRRTPPHSTPANSRSAGQKKLYIGNLPYDVKRDEITDFFGEFGTVQDLYIPVRDDGEGRGFAFITMDEEAAEKAIQEADGSEFLGRTLVVNVPKEKGEERAPARRNNNSGGGGGYGGGNKRCTLLPDDGCDDSDARGNKNTVGWVCREAHDKRLVFTHTESPCSGRRENGTDGTTTKSHLRKPPSRRCVFFNRNCPFFLLLTNAIYYSQLCSVAARPTRRLLLLVSAIPPPTHTHTVKMYVGNVAFSTSKEVLKGIFEEFGEVYDCYVPTDPSTDRPRGFAFVTMDQEAGMEAIAELDGLEIDGRAIRVNEAQGKPGYSSPPARRNSYNDDYDRDDNNDGYFN
jgi:RNA recognition motif-containing protein